MTHGPPRAPPEKADGSPLLTALIELGRELVGAYRPSMVVDRVAGALRRLFHPDHVLIVLNSTGGDELSVAYALNVTDAQPDDPLAALVIRSGPRVISSNLRTELAALGVPLPQPAGSWVGAPILASSTVGAVSISSNAPGRYTVRDLQLLTAVVTQAAIALEHARLMQLLSEGKREWEQTVDAIRQAFCVIDGMGTIRRANRAFCQLVQIPVTAIGGRAWMSLLPPLWTETVERVLAGGTGERTVELQGGRRLFTVTAHALGPTPDAGAVLVFEDETDKRRLQGQLIQSEKMSAIGQLIAGVAHDLNNPLASVVGFADYLVEGAGKAPEHLLEPLTAIRQEAERAASIVRNLLNFARKEHQRRPQQIHPILESTLTLLRNSLMASKVETQLQVDAGLPDIEVDANQLQQVCVNLINNAAQAIHTSGVGGTIQVHAMKWLDGIAVKIQDDGPGIPGDLADRVFEPFFTTKQDGGGTGLGLSICQGIIKEHGGRITLASGAFGGAIFRFELPGTKTEAAPVEATPTVYRCLNILVVDDEPHILHYMKATLEAWGHTVLALSDAREALKEIAAREFDVVITDIRMPALGGREFYEHLRRDHPALASRVVFSTGDTVRGDTFAFLETLGRPYLRKPFSLAELRTVLATTSAPR